MGGATANLGGKVAIVTGAASGIGRALAEELASRGCDVVLADRHLEGAREAAAAIASTGKRARGALLDVRDRAAWQQVVDETVAAAGRLDFLFNNAGIAVGADVAEYGPKDFDDVFDVNLRGVAYGILAAYPVMIRQRDGHIVNTASVAGLVATPATASYTATKHAVVGLSKSLRMEARANGVRVSALCPGAIRTPILAGGRYGRMKLDGATRTAILGQWERARPMAAEVFARKALERVLANDAIIVVPRWWKALWYLERLSPSLSLAFAAEVHRHIRGELGRSEHK